MKVAFQGIKKTSAGVATRAGQVRIEQGILEALFQNTSSIINY